MTQQIRGCITPHVIELLLETQAFQLQTPVQGARRHAQASSHLLLSIGIGKMLLHQSAQTRQKIRPGLGALQLFRTARCRQCRQLGIRAR